MPLNQINFFRDTSAVFTVLNNISDGFAFISNEWNIQFWNRSAERITGVHKDEVLSKNLWEVFNIAPDSIFYVEYLRAKQQNVTVEFETFFEPMNIWLEVCAYPINEGLVVYFKDTTIRKKLTLEVLNQKKQQEALINGSADVIYSVDKDFRLLAANKSFIRNTFNYSGIEIKAGDCVLDIMGKEEGDKWKPYYEQALNGESISHDRLIVYQANGEAIYTEIHFNPMRDEISGEITGVACYARDVTASRRYISLIEDKNAKLLDSDQKLHEAVQSLTKQNEILKEIAFMQSHEVRRPLANILGLIDALNIDETASENEYLVLLKKSSEELDQMIKKIVARTYEVTRHANMEK
jgi:PAS domain S-box-containing protein